MSENKISFVKIDKTIGCSGNMEGSIIVIDSD